MEGGFTEDPFPIVIMMLHIFNHKGKQALSVCVCALSVS